MSGKQHINEIRNNEDPTPTYRYEKNEDNDVQNVFRSKHHRQSYKTFYNPTNNGDEEKNGFDENGLAVKPFIKLHSTPP